MLGRLQRVAHCFSEPAAECLTSELWPPSYSCALQCKKQSLACSMQCVYVSVHNTTLVLSAFQERM